MGRPLSATSFPAGKSVLRLAMAAALLATLSLTAAAQDRDDEIVATLAGGRVIVHATRENLIFIAVNEPIEEAGSVPPRVVSLDSHHVGVLFGSSEWRIPAESNPIRLDKQLAHIANQDPKY